MSNKPRHLFSLLFVWIIIWIICIGFSIHIYKYGKLYPEELVGPERMRDAIYGIYIMLGTGLLFSLLCIPVWRIFWKNQNAFDSLHTEQEKSLHHSIFNPTLPLSLQGNLLHINRGFSIQTLDLNDLYWIHSYKSYGKVRYGITLCFYNRNGKEVKVIFDQANENGIYDIIAMLHKNNPDILISYGLKSWEYKKCKRIYKNRIK